MTRIACRALTSITILATIFLVGCSLSTDRTDDPTWTYPTAERLPSSTPAAPSEPVPTPTQGPPTPTTEPTATRAAGEMAPTPTPQPQGMVIGDERGVYWVEPISGETAPILAEPLSDNWALRNGRLALVRGRSLELIDLSTGQLQMLATDMPDEVVEMQVWWAASGDSLLLAGWAEPDPSSDEPVQELLLQELSLAGSTREAVAYQGPPAMILSYDQATQRALFWRPESNGLSILAADLRSGATSEIARVPAIGEPVVGPNGQLAALATSQAGYAILVTSLENTDERQTFALEPGTFASHIMWSPDGERLAYLLRKGEIDAPEVEDIGLMVLPLAAGAPLGPLASTLPYARIAGWDPSGEYVIVHNQSAEAQYYATVGLAGAGERLLPLSGAATLLGWLQQPSPPEGAQALDPWRGRFAAAAGDARLTADAAASYLAANADLSLDERRARLNAYYNTAGWPQDDRRIIALGPGLFALETPPNSIVFAADGRAEIVGQGQTLSEARSEGDSATLIWSAALSGAEQWLAALLQRQEDGSWQVVWRPQGAADWVTTNGVVQFATDGLASLVVSGSSLGLPSGAFFECSDCPLRQLSAIWRLTDGAYVRESSLPADAPADQVYWEMTVHTPYAIVYETVRRLRADQDLGELISSEAKQQLTSLELRADDLRLIVERLEANSVVFGPADASARYRATVENDRITLIEEY